MTSTPIFAAHRDAYLDAGWSGILVLPPDAKASPPAGYTGMDGRWPTRGDIDRWAREQPAGNIALRLPRDVIGVDFDLYRNPAARQLLEAITGPLPPTWCSTSRVDGSGIRFYRVPCPPSGTVWRSGGDGYDIVQHHHRYAVVWPSIHPEGRTYLWIDETSGEIAERPPEIDELTELPWAAIAALTQHHDRGESRAPIALEIPTGDMSVTVERRLMSACAATKGERGSRHDAACRDVSALMRLAERGEPGVDQALAVLRDAFVTAVAPDRPGAGAAAEREFDTIVHGAETLIASTIGRIPTRAERDAEWHALRDIAIVTLPSSVTTSSSDAPQPSVDDLTGWEPIDLAAVLADDYEPPRPDVCTRVDGVGLFYAGRVNALNGESGSGKSWVALLACAQQLMAGRAAIYIDLEDHDASVTGRLRLLGVPTRTILEQFVYINPGLPYGQRARELLDRITIARTVGIAVIDSVGESMALQSAKQNDDDDVARWFRFLARPLAQLGIAVVLIDHVPKQNDDTALYAIGSQRKRAAIDGVAYRVDTVVAFAKDRAGKLTLTCAKDRNGTYAKGQVVAEGHITPGSHNAFLELRAPAGRNSQGKVTRPTGFMGRISAFLEQQSGQPVSTNEIKRMVPGNAAAKQLAIEVLAEEGFIENVAGRFGPRSTPGFGYRSVRPFRDEIEVVESPPEVQPVPTSSNQFQPVLSELVEPPSQPVPTSSGPPPLGGAEMEPVSGSTDPSSRTDPAEPVEPSADPFEGLL